MAAIGVMPAVAQPHPDAELVAASAVFMQVDAKVWRLNRQSSDAWAAEGRDDMDEELHRWHQALDEVTKLPATTLDGMRAKAVVVIAAFKLDVPTGVGDTVEACAATHELVAYRLAQDIIGSVGA